MELAAPSGWQQVPLTGVGGGPDGNTLVSYVLQVQILENHQNGKDTHLRGIKIYAMDNEAGANRAPEEDDEGSAPEEVEEHYPGSPIEALERAPERRSRPGRWSPVEGGMTIPDFMKEPELR